MGEQEDSPDMSDDEWDGEAPQLCGTLNKWTNYIHGWQQRFMALKDGTLVYYKSASETDFGCRGAISVAKASVASHELDELRFDVSVGDSVWYLRAATVEDRERWVQGLQQATTRAAVPQRQGSALSLTSVTHSQSSVRGRSSQPLQEKLAECETFRDILCGQVDTLQSYFDACAASSSDRANLVLPNGLQATDFKGEAITFKATTAGILATLGYCLELLAQREEQIGRRLDREIGARKAAEERCKLLESGQGKVAMEDHGARKGPDFVEGPHSQMGEEEFYDAVESALDKLEEELELKDEVKSLAELKAEASAPAQHRLDPVIKVVTEDQLKYAKMAVEPGGAWELFADDGEMKMYKREEEVDGMVVDPLKALHSVRGVTAKELCHYFFSPAYRTEWEHTIDSMSVLEEISSDTLVFLQVHKRVWPTAQRDALFWSHMRSVEVTPEEKAAGVIDTWIVCNKSCEHPTAPLGLGGCLRVDLTVCFLCQTIATGDRNNRSNLNCKITYCSVVNPGGWAPASVLRTVYKREYPRFLKRFTQYVLDKTKGQPTLW